MAERMPFRLQLLKLADELRRRGIEPDLVDLEMWTDPELHYGENLRSLLEGVGKGGRSWRLARSSGRAVKRAAGELEAQRPRIDGPACPPGGTLTVRTYERKCPRPRRKKPKDCGCD